MSEAAEKIKGRFGVKVIRAEERSERRIYIDIRANSLQEFTRFLFRDLGLRFVTATGIDTPAGFEILYHFSDDKSGVMVSLRVLIADKKSPVIDSITPIIRGAEWIEREMWELLGIKFRGHPNLKHLLLIDEWPDGEYPLRHDKRGQGVSPEGTSP